MSVPVHVLVCVGWLPIYTNGQGYVFSSVSIVSKTGMEPYGLVSSTVNIID